MDISVPSTDRLRPGNILRRFRAWLILPHDPLSRLRQGILLFNLVIAAIFVQVAHSSGISSTQVVIMSFALIWLTWRWFLIVRQRTKLVYWDLAEGVAFAFVGFGLTSPLDTTGLLYLMLLYGALTFHALTLAATRVVISTLCYLLAYGAVLLGVMDGVPHEQLTRVGLLPIPALAFLAVLGSITARAFISQSTMATLRNKLDHASSVLGAAQDEEDIASTTCELATDLVGHGSAAACFLGRGERETLLVAPGATEDMVLAEPPPVDGLSAPLRARLEAGEAVVLDDGTVERLGQLAGHAFISRVHAVPLRNASELVGILVLDVPGSIDEVETEALEMLARHASLAIERVRSLQDLRWREEAYRSLVHHALDAMLVIAVNTTIQYEAPGFAALLGHEDGQFGQRFIDLVHPQDVRSVIAALTSLVDRPEASEIFECRLRCADESWLAVEVSAHNRLDDPAVSGVVLSCRDISERKELEARLNYQAFHDPLTALPNRSHFLARLNEVLSTTGHGPKDGPWVAVLFLDLDRFKMVNDSLGHEAGDRLLQVAAERLRNCVRPTDIVARFGGDEFAILLDDFRDEGQTVLREDAFASRVAKRIISSLQVPVTLGGQQIYISTSVGIAIARAGTIQPEEFLHHADVAMYAAKRESKGRYRIYDTSMVANALEQLQLESELHEAIQQGTLEVYYQPLISLHTGQVCQLEALVRWPHEKRGLLSPESFIPLAEETGQIIPLDTWVLEQVCRQLKDRLQQASSSAGIPPISVNLSALQFQQPQFAEDVARILRTWSIPPGLLKLEITEGAMMRDEQMTIETIDRLRRMGVKIAIDDFGVGYSSLSALRRFDVDTLKIDRSFIAGLGRDNGDTAIIQAMITYGTTVGMTVVAEGIETEDQLEHLRALGCDVGQGYFLARPYPSLTNLRPVRFVDTSVVTPDTKLIESPATGATPTPLPIEQGQGIIRRRG